VTGLPTLTEARRKKKRAPRCIVIAGPNGAGKTTFARDFLRKEVEVIHFVNADLIASGLSPLKPENATVAAGRLVLAELDRLARARTSFAFESTLSGNGYVSGFKRLKKIGYRIEIVYLKIDSPRLALRRIAGCIKQGGHNVRRADVLRRLKRTWDNFERMYRPPADRWSVYDNSGPSPILNRAVTMKGEPRRLKPNKFSQAVGRSLRRAAKEGRRIARMHGTPIYISKNGKVVAVKP
jgi:predicted ABC-type ATPase